MSYFLFGGPGLRNCIIQGCVSFLPCPISELPFGSVHVKRVFVRNRHGCEKNVLPLQVHFTAPFNNMQIFKAQPTNAFFTTVYQMFGGSSWLSTTAEHCFVD